MKKNYQTRTSRTGTGRVTPKKPRSDAEAGLVAPGAVDVVMSELTAEIREGLLAMAVGAGLQVMSAMMAEEVDQAVGPRGKWNAKRTAVRHGTDDGEVTLGGRRLPVVRPRMRSADGAGEVPLATYECFRSTELLGKMAMERMLAKLSTRRYAAGLEPVGEAVAQKARGTSKSAVSRRFVTATETALAELMASDLSGLDLVVLMIDGVYFAGHLCVVALGIDITGTKHPLALEEGDTENARVVKDLLAALRSRGLDTSAPILCVLDGAKALHAGVRAVFEHPVVQRCQLHKIRNVRDKLPDALGSTVEKKMRAAYRSPDPLAAEAALEDLARQLQKSHPGAAGSLREGLAETLTVIRLGVPPTLARTLRSTNPIESMIEICRDHSTTVKRWRDGEMVLRWCAAGMVEAKKQFRRVNGHLHLPALRVALDRYATSGTVTPADYDVDKEVAA
ncbi:MAG TPA: IS256 family transposase [Acidimicrobiales bacterium]|nr:IS256 family transposase [Acidimicrobiales bacterium]